MIDQEKYLFFRDIMTKCEGSQKFARKKLNKIMKKRMNKLFDEFLVTDPCGLFTEEEYKKNFE